MLSPRGAGLNVHFCDPALSVLPLREIVPEMEYLWMLLWICPNIVACIVLKTEDNLMPEVPTSSHSTALKMHDIERPMCPGHQVHPLNGRAMIHPDGFQSLFEMKHHS